MVIKHTKPSSHSSECLAFEEFFSACPVLGQTGTVLIAVVSTVIVPVAHPDIGDAGIVVTLVLVDWALFLRTSLLILPSSFTHSGSQLRSLCISSMVHGLPDRLRQFLFAFEDSGGEGAAELNEAPASARSGRDSSAAEGPRCVVVRHTEGVVWSSRT